jgi:hypothetical protein
MPTTRFLLLAILVTGLSAVAGCRLYCQHDVHRRLAQLHREYPDGYDTLIDSLLRAPCVQGQASVLIADQDQPASIRAAGPSFVKIDARGYLVLYFYAPWVWRGIVLKKTNCDATAITVPHDRWQGDAATYVGHHVP